MHSASILKSLGLFTRAVTIFAARFTGGFNRFVTSTVAPVASGWSSLAAWNFHPLGKRAALSRRTPTAVFSKNSRRRYLFLTGRTAELIISGGVNIYPQEIDSELLKHPAVMDVCTIGIPDDEWGEVVQSVVQLNKSFTAGEALSEELIQWARDRLANFKCPRIIAYSEDLPRLPSGKIQRRIVRDQYLGRDGQGF